VSGGLGRALALDAAFPTEAAAENGVVELKVTSVYSWPKLIGWPNPLLRRCL
jgi:hypothetical protein